MALVCLLLMAALALAAMPQERRAEWPPGTALLSQAGQAFVAPVAIVPDAAAGATGSRAWAVAAPVRVDTARSGRGWQSTKRWRAWNQQRRG